MVLGGDSGDIGDDKLSLVWVVAVFKPQCVCVCVCGGGGGGGHLQD